MTVIEVLDSHQGLTLAKTDTGHFLVGILYSVGRQLDKLDPHVDFLSTTNEQVARNYFQRHKEGK